MVKFQTARPGDVYQDPEYSIIITPHEFRLFFQDLSGDNIGDIMDTAGIFVFSLNGNPKGDFILLFTIHKSLVFPGE